MFTTEEMEDAYEDADTGSFLSLKDGDEYTGAIVSPMYGRMTHFIKQEKRSYDCTRDDDCEYCLDGNRASFKFVVVMSDETGRKTPIFECSRRTWGVILTEFKDEKLDPQKFPIIRLRRTGSTAQDTVYTCRSRGRDLDTKVLEDMTVPDPLSHGAYLLTA